MGLSLKKQRATVDHSTMKLAISIIFLATTSTGAPSMSLRRTMPIGHAQNTLVQNQKQTAMKIQHQIVHWIQHLEDILKLSIERQHNETSQLHKYIEALEKKIMYLKNDTDENLKALQENTKENLISLQTITNWNDEKILEATVMDSMKHLDTSLNTGKSGSNFKKSLSFLPSDSAPASPSNFPSVNLKSWSYKEPIISTVDVETFSPPRRLPMISTNTTQAPFNTNTMPAPHSTRPPCIASGLKNC